jgi:hypothetical protein
MKAEELRIGNLVNFFDDNTIFVVTEINSIGIGVENKEEATWIELDRFEPIPLTEEWLTKLGFKGRIDFKWIDIVGIQIRGDKYYLAPKDLSNVIFHSIVEIKHVHQLQNIHFALTSKELKIKE